MPSTSNFAEQLKLQLPSWMNSMQLTGFSKDFFELVRDIGEAKSKEEEERIIKNEAQKLKTVMTQPEHNKRMREYLIRAIYCIMLGHDVPFAYIHALNMTQDPKIYNKRTAYLAVSLCLHENHELMIMVVNSIQKGLLSTNYLEICSALIALCKLINEDTIPAFLPTVVSLLTHNKAAVRKKAVMAIHKFWLKSPDSIIHLGDKLRIVLCDRDPSVMAATLCLFLDLARTQVHEFKDLVPSFVSILKQVAENRLPRSYEYHLVPAPWIQINLLRLLGIFGANDQAASENMYEVLHQVMQKAERHKNNAGFGVLYECIRTVISIRATPELLEAAASSIGEFLKLRNHNLKYLGITSLASIVKIAPRFVAPHQLDIIECLESTDESLKRKTLDLLYRMTNTKNVVATTAKLIEYLQHTVATDEHVRAELVSRIAELAERYAPTNHWYIDTMGVMLHLGGALIRSEVAHNLIRLIAQGSGENEETDNNLRGYAVSTFLRNLEAGGPNLPDIEVHVTCWVVGEYGYLAEIDPSLGVRLDLIISQVSDLLDRPHETPSTQGWVLSALLKLVAQLQICPPQVLALIHKYSRSRYIDSQLRANEIHALVRAPHIMEEVLPIDASCEDIEVDPGLAFLDEFVREEAAAGAKPYLPADQRKAASTHLHINSGKFDSGKKELHFSYPAPPPSTITQIAITSPVPAVHHPPVNSASSGLNTFSSSKLSMFAGTSTAPPTSITAVSLPSSQLKVPSVVWTKEGFQGKQNRPATKLVSTQQSNAFTPTPTATSHPTKSNLTPTKLLNESQQQLFVGLNVGSNGDSVASQSPIDRFHPQTKSPPKQDVIAKSTANPHATAPVAPSSDLLIDLLGDLSFPSSSQAASFSSVRLPTPTVTSPYTRSRYAPPQAQKTTIRPTTPPSAMHDVLLSLDMKSGLSFSPTPNSSFLDSTTDNNSGDIALAPSAPLATQVTPGDDFGLHNLSHTPLMWNLLDGCPTSGTNQMLSGDANLRVSYLKAFKKEDTVALFFMSNANAAPITDVCLEITVPDHFAAESSVDKIVCVNINNNVSRFTVPSIGPHITLLVAVKLRHRKHGFNLSLVGNAKYRAPAANATSKGKDINLSTWQVPIEISDMLRPLVLNTDTFGKQWAVHMQEKKARFTPTTPFVSSSALLEVACKGLSIKLVQLIGNEGIAAGVLLNGDVCLMHTSVVGLAVDVTVRTKDKSFTEIIVRQLHKIIR